MIDAVVEWSERNRVAVVVGVIALGLVAGAVAMRLELDALPDVTNNQVMVLAKAPGFTPEEVEQRVARPIEVAIAGVPGLETTRSVSRYGVTAVTAVFGDDVDPYRARQMVSERIAGVATSLPYGVETPELGPYTGGLGEVVQFTMRSRRRTSAQLLELMHLRVSPILRTVPGVVEVNSWGGSERTLDVEADPARMATLGVGLEELARAVSEASSSRPGDALTSGSGRTLLRAVSWPRDPSELGAAVVRAESHTGRTIRVADVATVREGRMPRLGAATRDGLGEVVFGMAQMVRGGNARTVVSAVEARLPDVRRALPSDVVFDVVYERSVLVDRTLSTVATNLLEGGLLVAIVLLVLLGSVRAGLVVAATIPLAMLVALALMVTFGIPGNLMSLGAIDFGLVVDGGVVMVESVFHRMQHGDVTDRRALVREAMGAMARPVVFSVLIITLVYVPVLTLQGVDGKLFAPMAATVVFALLGSLVLSVTFVPAAASLVLEHGKLETTEPRIVRLAAHVHDRALGVAMRHPRIALGVAMGLLVLALVLVSRAGSEFVPQIDEGDLIIETTRSPEIRLETAVEDAGRVERALIGRIPEVRSVVSRIGSPTIAIDLMGLEQADVLVSLKPREEWRPGLTHDALVEEIDRRLERYAPGGFRDYTQPIQMRFNELLGGSVSDVAITVYGEDLAMLRTLAERMRSELEHVPGAEDVRISAPPSVDLIEVRPTELHTAHVGLSPAGVVTAIQALRQGVPLGETYDGPLRIPIRLRLGGVATVYDLPRAIIPVGGGRLVPIGQVAELTPLRSPGAVEHTDGQRRITVGFNVRGRDLGSVVSEVRSRLHARVPLPRGYRDVYGGQYANMREAYGRLAVVVPVVLLLIVVMLTWMFKRLGTALVVFSHVPFAAVGGAIALAIRGMPVSVSAMIGFIALSGIAVLNGVVLVTRMIALEGEGKSVAEAAGLAARERMRPVVMTASVAALGFVPMMLATGVGAEVQRPLATVVVGGLVTSTLLTLLVLPAVRAHLASMSFGRRAA